MESQVVCKDLMDFSTCGEGVYTSGVNTAFARG